MKKAKFADCSINACLLIHSQILNRFNKLFFLNTNIVTHAKNKVLVKEKKQEGQRFSCTSLNKYIMTNYY